MLYSCGRTCSDFIELRANVASTCCDIDSSLLLLLVLLLFEVSFELDLFALARVVTCMLLTYGVLFHS